MKYSFVCAIAFALLVSCGDASKVSGSATGESDTADPFFATQPGGPSGAQALYRGPLVVADGCVFIGRNGDYSVPVWPEGFAIGHNSSGQLTVLNGDGATVAVEGEDFEMGGGYTAEFRPADKVEPKDDQLQQVADWLGYSVPDACLGRDVYGVWVVGEIKPVNS